MEVQTENRLLSENRVKSLTSKYVAILIVILVAMTAGMDAIMANYFADQYCIGFVAIPIYFLIIGALILALVSRSVTDAKKYTRAYLLTRTIKILSFILLCAIGAIVMPIGKVAYIITSFSFAAVFMTFETIVLLKLNKEVHEIQQNNQK